MRPLSYDLAYNIYILLFGVYVSMCIACGHFTAKQWRLYSVLCPVLLLIQGIVLYLFNAETVRFLYPVITHLPLVLLLIFREKVKCGIALVSVSISYSVCQLPRWIGLFLSLIHLPPASAAVIHIALSQLLLVLLDRLYLTAIHSVIRLSPKLLLSFGTLPVIYYLFEYFMLYTHKSYVGLSLLNELLPTALIFFFILFVIVYQQEAQKRMQTENQMHSLQMELVQADQNINTLRAIEEQTAIFRHDLRHHLTLIAGLLASGKQEAALQYIRETQEQIDAIIPLRLCANETVNLLLCAYKERANRQSVSLSVKAELPEKLPLSDTELCAMLSNGLENALSAVSDLPQCAERSVDVFFCVRQDNLLLEIKNPYHSEVFMEKGLPVSRAPGSHYGCRSIQSIALRRQGMCTFSAIDGIFTLRVVIPLKTPDIPHRS